MIIQDLNFCEASASVNDIAGGFITFANFSFDETLAGSFTSTIGAFASTSNTSAGSLFQGTIAIDSVVGVVNGVTFVSNFSSGKFVQVTVS